MADKEINELSPTSTLDGTELVHVEQGSTSVRSTVEAIAARFGAITRALTKGYTATPHDLGTVTTGTITLDPADNNMQDLVNGGAFTLAAPTASGSFHMTLDVTNNGSAGAVTVTGFDSVSGDDFTTTDGDAFTCYIKKGTAGKSIFVEAMQ